MKHVPQHPVGERFFVSFRSTDNFVEATPLEVFEENQSMKRIRIFSGSWLQVQRLNDVQSMSIHLSRSSVSCSEQHIELVAIRLLLEPSSPVSNCSSV